MSDTQLRHVFGPVPSRRLGRSLGVDLVPFKTCSYDCIYCQLGRTTNKTVRREAYVPLEEVLADLDRALAQGPPPDYITLSGSGEPTLHAQLGKLVARIKAMTAVPLAVLTNGSLLWDAEVREALLPADLVIPSLDAGDARAFEAVNRPHPDISFERMVGGLRSFRRAYRGDLRLEVFLLAPVTDDGAQVEKIARLAAQIGPDRVERNTVARPPAEADVAAILPERLNDFARLFSPPADVVADYRGAAQDERAQVTEAEVMDLLSRRPCTLDDLAAALRIHRNEASKHIAHLLRAGAIMRHLTGGRAYFGAAPGAETETHPTGMNRP